MKIAGKITVLLITLAVAMTSSQIAVADASNPSPGKGTSTSIKPVQNPKPNSHFTVNTTEASHLENVQYSSLPTCPRKPLCPNINGQYPQGGSRETCPDKCSVTRIVEEYQLGGMTRITRVVPAVCPLNYVKIADYNLQKEIIYDNGTSVIEPISDAEKLRTYRSLGYNCQLNYSSPHKTRYCSWSEGLTPPTTHNDPNLHFHEDMVIEGALGKYIVGDMEGFCRTRAGDCDGPPVDCGVIHSRNYFNTYYRYQCTSPKGFYYSNNLIPASTVCTSHLPKWKQAN